MLSIPEKNETIYQVVFETFKKPNMKNLTEFGFFDYIIYPIVESNIICMAFKAPGFKEILNYSGKEFLQEEFKDYTFEENVKIYDKDYDVSIQIDIKKFLPLIKKKRERLTEEEKKKNKEELKPLIEEFINYRKLTAEKFSHFRIKIYASVLNKMLLEVKENKNPKLFKMHLKKDNIL